MFLASSDIFLGKRKGIYLESAGTTPTPPSYTYATLNPADKDANITLSGGNLIATSGNEARKSIRATIGKSTGKRYIGELTVGATGTDFINGVGKLTADINTYCGADTDGWAYYSNSGSAARVNNASFDASYGSVYSPGDVISILLDMDVGALFFWKNGVVQGDGIGTTAYTGLTGTLYPMFSLYANGASYTVNFGATPFIYTPPVGYNVGLYF